GDLKTQAAGLGDEVEILLGEREHGDLGEVDLLRAGEREQKIERAFEALDIDHQRVTRPRLEPRVLVLPIGDHIRPAWPFAHRRLARAHATLVPAASVTSAMASASAKGPPRAFMPMSSLIRKPVNPMKSRITFLIITADALEGRAASKVVSRTWAVMASGASRSAWKGRKSTASSSAAEASMRGSARWLSAFARPWPGTCLIAGRTPPARHPSITARPSAITASGLVEKARSPMISCAPLSGTSRTGVQSTVMPQSWSSCAISRVPAKAAFFAISWSVS